MVVMVDIHETRNVKPDWMIETSTTPKRMTSHHLLVHPTVKVNVACEHSCPIWAALAYENEHHLHAK